MEQHQQEVKDALEQMKFVHSTRDEFKPGVMGDQIVVFLENVDAYDFSFSLDDVDINCVLSIVNIKSGDFHTDTPADAELRIILEVIEYGNRN